MADQPSLDRQLKDLAALEANWNSYGEKPIAAEALAVVGRLHFSPMFDGGVQIELVDEFDHWVEIRIAPDGEIDSASWGPRNTPRAEEDEPGGVNDV